MTRKFTFYYLLLLAVIVFAAVPSHAQLNFTSSNLGNCTLANPSSLQFGKDGRLYVAQQDGTIRIFSISRSGPNSYSVTSTETVLLVKQIPNHYDDGTLKPFNTYTNRRQVTGLYVTGTAANPVIYVCSSDNDIGAGSNGDKNLCTNSGILSRLTWNGTQWQKMDLVRGLPRSEENHAPNGIQVDEEKQMLYLAVGGFTNAGAPSKLFAYTCEYALSACVLSIDLKAIEAMPVKDAGGLHPYKYDLPTLDDPTRSNNADGSDQNDPFGGNDGLNQARIIEGGPVQVFAPGFRNPYDLVITRTPGRPKRMYLIDNGANPNWGGYPENEGAAGKATNNYVPGEPGSVSPGGDDGIVDNLDGLHRIDLATYVSGSYYGGHPCPVRANPAGAGLYTHSGTLETGTGVWRTTAKDPDYPLPADWPPVPLSMANPVEGDFQNPGIDNNALLTFDVSTNGICEYTASNFGSAMKGDLLAINFEGTLYRIKLAEDGTVLNARGAKRLNQDPPFASGFGTKGLDVTSQGDNDYFPGTIWVVNYASNTITVFEPQDIQCSGTYSLSADDDKDGYSNADELDNGTDPCSAASRPDDNDTDLISDRNDADDDNDGYPDTRDPFALDKSNGDTTFMPVTYSLFNNDPGTGFFGLGFTGLMTNKTTDYRQLYNKDNLIAGGAIGAFTIDKVSAGDAEGTLNNQEYAFQFGVHADRNTPPFVVKGAMLGRFFNGTAPSGYQSQGIYIGNGDQDNYLKVALNANNGQGGIEVIVESEGIVSSQQFPLAPIPSSTLNLMIAVDPLTATAQVRISSDGGQAFPLGNPIALTGPLRKVLQDSGSVAVGVIATSRGGAEFNATWDLISVGPDASKSDGNWNYLVASDSSVPEHRHEDGFVQCGDKFYLLGGRGIKPVNEYDPATKTWKAKSKTPVELNHFQAVALNNLIYVICAFNGGYPNETPVPNIYIYDPATDRWIKGREIPAARRRGSAGVTVYNNKIYIAAGIINGHMSGFVNWLDEYDPATNEWKVLQDAPRARDHFQAAVNGGKLYLAGGRRSSGATGQVFNFTVPEVDIYNFATGTWSTNVNGIPTQRAGCTAVSVEEEVIIIGGESMAHMRAHSETEALNTTTGTWRSLDTLNQGRHGTQAIASNGGIYITGGSSSRGGSASTELSSVEEFHFTTGSAPSGEAIVRSGIEGPASITFGTIASGSTARDTIRIKNVDGNQAVIIQGIRLYNNADSAFAFQSPHMLPFFIAPDKAIAIPVSFTAGNRQQASADLVLVHSGKGDSTIIHLVANPAGGGGSVWSPLYYINAGGAATDNGSQHWLGDAPESPSAYSNYKSTFNKTTQLDYTGANATDAPSYIFNAYRWDGGVKGNALSQEMQWTFPAAQKGEYRVDLYFAESYAGTSKPGQRIFDIMIEDTVRTSNMDIVAEAGFKNAIKKSYSIYVSDGNLNIIFIHEVQNPIVSGIAVYKKNAQALATLWPSSVDYGDQAVHTVASRNITISNTGAFPVTISSAMVSGKDAASFRTNFTSAFTLLPGRDTALSVTFKPGSEGVKSAVCGLYSPDLADTLYATLSGNGIQPATFVTITRPSDGATFAAGDSVNIEVSVDTPPALPYLKINCPDGGWRKLRIGYNAYNIFNPMYNPAAGGNDRIEIVLKAVTDVNWSKIQIRPQGNTTNPVVLSRYISGAAILGDGYMKVTIPLADFDPSVNFTQLSLIEFPYSAGAGGFEMNLQSLVFTGGSTPFTWFGNGKTDNKHDGAGGGGQLIAGLEMPGGKAVRYVYFYINQELTGVDSTSPYSYKWTHPAPGNYELTAKALFTDGAEEISNTIAITVVATLLREGSQEQLQEVIYRVNAGGERLKTASGLWESDSAYVNVSNTIVLSRNGAVTVAPNVPGETPAALFQTERVAENDSLSYRFPVEEGGEVEVRLYFTEAEEGAGEKVFDIAIEDSIKAKGTGTTAEKEKRKGFMKVFRATSDGSIDIDLVKVVHNPSVSGIEIICLNNKCDPKKGRTLREEQKKITAQAYPNPFGEHLLINFTAPAEGKASLQLYNQRGELLKEIEVSLQNHTQVQIDLSGLPTGIYFMKVISGGAPGQVLKLIKE